MADQIVIDNQYATLRFHPDTKIVHHEWKGYIHGQAFRDVLMQGCDLMKQRGGGKWLSDDRRNGALPDDDSAWATGVWFPAVKAAGWKHWAVVMPTKVVGQLNMKTFVARNLALGINTQVFDDPDKAYAWLVAQK